MRVVLTVPGPHEKQPGTRLPKQFVLTQWEHGFRIFASHESGGGRIHFQRVGFFPSETSL